MNDLDSQIAEQVKLHLAKQVIPMNFGPEEVDINYILSETEKYSAWESRKPSNISLISN